MPDDVLEGDFWDYLGSRNGPLSLLHVCADWIDQQRADLRTLAMMLRDIGIREPKPFLTGSRAYGTPLEQKDTKPGERWSDTDVCCLATSIERQYVRDRANPKLGSGERNGLLSVYFGPYNVIMFEDRLQFEAWHAATIELTKKAPVDKQTAIKVIDGTVAEWRKREAEKVKPSGWKERLLRGEMPAKPLAWNEIDGLRTTRLVDGSIEFDITTAGGGGMVVVVKPGEFCRLTLKDGRQAVLRNTPDITNQVVKVKKGPLHKDSISAFAAMLDQANADAGKGGSLKDAFEKRYINKVGDGVYKG